MMKTLRLLEARVLGSSPGVQRKRGGPCSRIPPATEESMTGNRQWILNYFFERGRERGKKEEERRGGKGQGGAEGRLGMYLYMWVRQC